MTGKQARGLFQALFVSLSVAVASAQAIKNSTVVAPAPSPSPAAGAKTNLPAATERKAGGATGTLSCDGKPAVTKARKAGGNPAINPCFKPGSSTMRKAGGEQQALCTNEKGGKSPLNGDGKPAEIEMRKAGGDQNSAGKASTVEFHRKAGGKPDSKASDAGVVIAIRPSSSLNGDGKTTNSSKARKAGGDGGVHPCIKPSGKKSSQTGGTTGLNGDGKSGLNGDGKPAKTNMRKAGGDVGIDPCFRQPDKTRKTGGTTGFICDGAKPSAAKTRKAGGQGIVRPNCSSATKAISGSTGGAPQPAVPQTQVPK
jgi:hypothetical protein